MLKIFDRGPETCDLNSFLGFGASRQDEALWFIHRGTDPLLLFLQPQPENDLHTSRRLKFVLMEPSVPCLLLSSRAFSGHQLSFPVMFLSESTAAFDGGGNPTVNYALMVDHGREVKGKEEIIGEEIEI